MTKIKQNRTPATPQDLAVRHEWEMDLSDERQSMFVAQCIGAKSASVSIESIGAVGTTITAAIKQSHSKTGIPAAPTLLDTLAVAGPTAVDYGTELEMSCDHLVVDLAGSTIGNVGRVKIVIVMKS